MKGSCSGQSAQIMAFSLTWKVSSILQLPSTSVWLVKPAASFVVIEEDLVLSDARHIKIHWAGIMLTI